MKTVKAGDLIQYRYRVGEFTNYDARIVEMVDDSGCWVNGGYLVPLKDVLFVMPESEPPAVAGGSSFPMETGQ